MAEAWAVIFGMLTLIFAGAWWRAVDRMHWAEAQLFAYRKVYGPKDLPITRREP